MFGGKKIQNYITFQTKQTIFLKQNQPQLIVHQQKFQTDSLKQLLSKRSSKSKHKFFQSNFNNQKLNHQQNQIRKQSHHKNSHFASSNSHSNAKSKQRSYGSKSKEKKYQDQILHKHTIKEFDLKQHLKKQKSSKQKLSKKVKSMIRLPKFNQKNIFEFQKSKIGRKSYSPNRNYSEGIKKSTSNLNIKQNHCSNQYVKTTKFTQSKQNTSKNLKIKKVDKKQKKVTQQKNKKLPKSKQKEKSLKHEATKRSNFDKKDYSSTKRENEIFTAINFQKSKKISKKISPTKITKRKDEDYKNDREHKQRMLPKKRKSMTRSKKNIHFQSVEDGLLRQHDFQKSVRVSNYISCRDSLKKKIKTDRDSLNNKPKKKLQSLLKQKAVIVSSKNLNKLKNQAATKIQKIYKGYITRKWLKQYLRIINAAVVIQKHWRGYQQRKKWNQILRKAKFSQSSKQQQTFNQQFMFEDAKIDLNKLKNILFEVMEQKSVNQHLKSKIKNFLEAQADSAISSIVSRRSNQSQERLKQEILSEKKYFQKKIRSKQQKAFFGQVNLQNQLKNSFLIEQECAFEQIKSSLGNKHVLNSPFLVSRLFSPQSVQISPRLQKIQSPQSAPGKVQQIQYLQRQNLILQAQNEKNQLNKILQNKIRSPSSSEAKDKAIKLQLKQFIEEQNLSNSITIEDFKNTRYDPIKQQISKTKLSKSYLQHLQQDFSQTLMITPEHSYLQQQPDDFQSQQLVSKQFQQITNENQKSGVSYVLQKNQLHVAKMLSPKKRQRQKVQNEQNNVPTYQNFQTFNINAKSSQKSTDGQKIESLKKIDPSYSFVDEYLLTMIQFLRSYNQGKVMIQMVRSLKTWKNLQPYTILQNLSVVKDENSQEEDAFSLPLYKYLQDDAEIIKEEYVTEFNKYFNMMKESHRFSNGLKHSNLSAPQEQAIQYYLKLLTDCFNEALNTKRPSKYLFTNRAIESYNSELIVRRDEVNLESEYDLYCASAMQQIFSWFSVKFGIGLDLNNVKQLSQSNVNFNGELMGVSVEQIRQIESQNTSRLEVIMKMQAEKSWDEYYQNIEVIARLSEQIFEDLLIRETYTMLNIERKMMRTRQIQDF